MSLREQFKELIIEHIPNECQMHNIEDQLFVLQDEISCYVDDLTLTSSDFFREIIEEVKESRQGKQVAMKIDYEKCKRVGG